MPGAQTLFSSPQPTPTGCTREDTLQSMVRALQEKLTTELHFRDEAQIKTTEAAPLSNEVCHLKIAREKSANAA